MSIDVPDMIHVALPCDYGIERLSRERAERKYSLGESSFASFAFSEVADLRIRLFGGPILRVEDASGRQFLAWCMLQVRRQYPSTQVRTKTYQKLLKSVTRIDEMDLLTKWYLLDILAGFPHMTRKRLHFSQEVKA